MTKGSNNNNNNNNNNSLDLTKFNTKACFANNFTFQSVNISNLFQQKYHTNNGPTIKRMHRVTESAIPKTIQLLVENKKDGMPYSFNSIFKHLFY